MPTGAAPHRIPSTVCIGNPVEQRRVVVMDIHIPAKHDHKRQRRTIRDTPLKNTASNPSPLRFFMPLVHAHKQPAGSFHRRTRIKHTFNRLRTVDRIVPLRLARHPAQRFNRMPIEILRRNLPRRIKPELHARPEA